MDRCLRSLHSGRTDGLVDWDCRDERSHVIDQKFTFKRRHWPDGVPKKMGKLFIDYPFRSVFIVNHLCCLLMKALIVRLLAAVRGLPFVVRKSIGCDSKTLTAEQLEPRILYSAAPVEVPGDDVEAPAQEASAAAPAAADAAAESQVATPVAAVVEGDGENSEIAQGQEVALIDVDEAAVTLNQEVVETLAAEARQRWIDSGISAQQIAALDSVSYEVADVGGAHLGVANGFSITIDDAAGGTGVGNWFVDATPGQDEEFGGSVSASAAGRYDLLSTLIHEQGHVLGLGDLYDQRSDVMHGFLDVGTRRLPVEGQAEDAIAGSIAGDNFLMANILRASTSTGDAEANEDSEDSALSADGRYLVFSSYASNLVANDTNNGKDIFLRDMHTGVVTRISTNVAGDQGSVGGYADDPIISSDGRFVVFQSSFNNLVADDTNSQADIFVKDLITGEVVRANTDADGNETIFSTFGTAMSADGRYVAFVTRADDLVDQPVDGENHVFVKDLETGEVKLGSTTSAGELGNSFSLAPLLSGDGRYLAFVSVADNLVAGDSNGEADVFVKDLKTGRLTRASTTSSGGEATGGLSTPVAISGDGRKVVFISAADNLVADDTNGMDDVFIKDLVSGKVVRVNTDASGAEANSFSSGGSISADGRFVAFHSLADNLVEGDTNGERDVFVKDLSTGEVTRVSTQSNGDEAAGGDSQWVSISADGRFVVFASEATDLVAGDSNGYTDIFAKAISSINHYTTSVHVDGAGNLIIEDIEGGDTKDNLFIEMKDGRLEISDKKNTVGSSIFGSMLVGTKGRAVSIDPLSFGGDIIVRTLDGDDTITIGDLSGLAGGITIEDGDGQDLIRQKGVVTLTGAAELRYEAEQVRLEKKSSISTESGDIALLGNSLGTSEKKSIGIRATRSSITSSVGGDILFYGVGGEAGSGNRGVVMNGTEVIAAGGSVNVSGYGGDGVSRNDGVTLGKSTLISVSSGGSLSVAGTGGGSGSSNRGVVATSEVRLETKDGHISFTGEGGNGASGNSGLDLKKISVIAGGTGHLYIDGSGQGSGSRNIGAVIKGSTLMASGAGNVFVAGSGSAASSGSGNGGLQVASTALASRSGDFTIEGNGGMGRNSNWGLRVESSSLHSDSGIVSLEGSSRASTSGAANRGTYLKNSDVSGHRITMTGEGGGGTSRNEGFRGIGVSATSSGGGISLGGEALATTTGVRNSGLNLIRSDIDANFSTAVSGVGGGGSQSYGMFANRVTVSSQIGSVVIDAEANDATTGNGNYGASLKNISITRATAVLVNGEGGTGKNSNYGLTIVGGSVSGVAGLTTVSGTAEAATTGSGNGGLSLRNFAIDAGTSVDLIGTGGGGTSHNRGLRVDGGGVSGGSDDLSVTGTAQAGSTGNSNFGVQAHKTTFQASGNVDVDGIGGGGKNSNYGVHLSRVVVEASGSTAGIVGNAAATTQGRNNHGVFLNRTSVSATDEADVRGTGGGGTNNNQGIRFIGGDISADGLTYLKGIAFAGTTGKGNVGLYIVNGTQIGEDAELYGTGGGGTGKNYGVFMNKNISAPGASVAGTATDGVSEDEVGDHFNP